MSKKKVKVTVTFGTILDSGYWDDFCSKYGYNPWMINEGLADSDEEVSINLSDAKEYGLLDE